ncbi:MAG: hypothetical protein AB7O97_04965 [Planctomycetota bacterium]
MNRIAPLALVPFLALPIAAQETASPGPLLTLRTTQTRVAHRVARELGMQLSVSHDGDQCVTLTLGRDRGTAVEVRDGDGPLLELEADVQGLLQAYEKELVGYQAMMRGVMVMSMQQQGMPVKDAAAFVGQMLAFPEQLSKATLRVTGDPKFAEGGLDIEFALEARPDSAMGKVVADLRPSPAGAPVLDGEAPIAMRVSMDPKGLAALASQLTRTTLAMAYQEGESFDAMVKVTERMFADADGGMVFAIDSAMTMQMILGFQKAETLQDMFTSGEYQDAIRGQRLLDRNMEVTVTPAAFEHRGVTFLKSHVTNDGPPNPVMPDGETTSFTAAAAGFLVMSGNESEARGMVDAALDGKIERAALPDESLLTLDVRVPAMVELFGAALPRRVRPEDLPAAAKIALAAKGRRLVLTVHVE